MVEVRYRAQFVPDDEFGHFDVEGLRGGGVFASFPRTGKDDEVTAEIAAQYAVSGGCWPGTDAFLRPGTFALMYKAARAVCRAIARDGYKPPPATAMWVRRRGTWVWRGFGHNPVEERGYDIKQLLVHVLSHLRVTVTR